MAIRTVKIYFPKVPKPKSLVQYEAKYDEMDGFLFEGASLM
jgi:hypothetical protein